MNMPGILRDLQLFCFPDFTKYPDRFQSSFFHCGDARVGGVLFLVTERQIESFHRSQGRAGEPFNEVIIPKGTGYGGNPAEVVTLRSGLQGEQAGKGKSGKESLLNLKFLFRNRQKNFPELAKECNWASEQ